MTGSQVADKGEAPKKRGLIGQFNQVRWGIQVGNEVKVKTILDQHKGKRQRSGRRRTKEAK